MISPLKSVVLPLATVAVSSAAILLAGCVSDPAASALSGPSPSQAGRALAQSECSGCHAIGELGGSPRAGVPPLREVLDHYSASRLKASFQEGMLIGHAEMPIYRLSEQETDALLAYLQDIKQ